MGDQPFKPNQWHLCAGSTRKTIARTWDDIANKIYDSDSENENHRRRLGIAFAVYAAAHDAIETVIPTDPQDVTINGQEVAPLESDFNKLVKWRIIDHDSHRLLPEPIGIWILSREIKRTSPIVYDPPPLPPPLSLPVLVLADSMEDFFGGDGLTFKNVSHSTTGKITTTISFNLFVRENDNMLPWIRGDENGIDAPVKLDSMIISADSSESSHTKTVAVQSLGGGSQRVTSMSIQWVHYDEWESAFLPVPEQTAKGVNYKNKLEITITVVSPSLNVSEQPSYIDGLQYYFRNEFQGGVNGDEPQIVIQKGEYEAILSLQTIDAETLDNIIDDEQENGGDPNSIDIDASPLDHFFTVPNKPIDKYFDFKNVQTLSPNLSGRIVHRHVSSNGNKYVSFFLRHDDPAIDLWKDIVSQLGQSSSGLNNDYITKLRVVGPDGQEIQHAGAGYRKHWSVNLNDEDVNEWWGYHDHDEHYMRFYIRSDDLYHLIADKRFVIEQYYNGILHRILPHAVDCRTDDEKIANEQDTGYRRTPLIACLKKKHLP